KWEASVKGGAAKGLPKEVQAVLAVAPAKRNPKQKQALANYYRSIAPELQSVRQQLAELQQEKEELKKAIPSTLDSEAGAPSVTRVLPRGSWLDDSGQVVQPGVPASLSRLDVQGRRATRLDLGHWMAAPDNPLTARVFVNRLWKLFFGQGIVRTLDDFGSQGA